MFRMFTQAILRMKTNSQKGQSSSITPSSCAMSSTNGTLRTTFICKSVESPIEIQKMRLIMKRVRQKVCVLTLLSLALLCANSAVAQTERTDKEYEVGAALWMQSSGEKRALA